MHFVMNCKQGRARPVFVQLLMVMKLTSLFLLATALQVSAGAFSQKVSLKMDDVSLEKAFRELRKQSGMLFLYDNEEVKKVGRISVNVSNVSVEEALQKMLSETSFTFRVMDKTIVLTPKVNEVANAATARKPLSFDLRGRVTSETGEPLAGVVVLVKGKNALHAITTENGNYELKGVEDNDVVEFSLTGYKKREVKVTSAKKELNIVMEIQVNNLSEVVVNGYQNIQKKIYTGAATTLKADDVKMAGINDVSRMLEGRAAGVSIQNVSGTFGAAPKVRVRGATSISGENKPLWVVDGIVLEDVVNISNDQLSSGDPSTLLGSAVAGLNPEDIATFEILKDASATALYGGRAMNGVIVITTKKGKAGKPSINYTGNYTVKLKPSYDNYNIMNSADQMSVYSELYRKGWLNYPSTVRRANGGVFTKMYQQISTFDESTGQYVLANTPEARAAFLDRYAKANTDWFDILFRNSLTQEHSLSISSGTNDAQYYFSTSFLSDDGWTIGDNVKRYTANIRANYKLSNKLSAGLATVAAVRQQRAPGSNARIANVVEGIYTREFDINPFSYALNTSRTLTAYDEEGNLEYFTRNYAPFNILNELRNNYIQLNMMDVRLQGEIGYKFNKSLEFNSIAALRYAKTSREHKIMENSNTSMAYRANYDATVNGANRYLYTDPDNPDADAVVVLPEGGFYNRNEDQLVNYNIRNSLNWKKEYNYLHNIQVLVGQEIKYTNRQNSWNNGYGYQYDKGGIPFTDYKIIKQLLEGNFNYFGMSENYDRGVSFFANAIYAFNEKYVFNGTFRYDGSNRMGKSPRARWLPTWTLSGAWNIDQESFMENVTWLDALKLRGAYGLTASIGSASNTAVVLENTSTKRPVFSDIESQIVIAGLENSELTWEKQYEANIGFDAISRGGKWTLTVDAYKRNGFDLINSIRTTGIGGQSVKTANYADMNSKGVEVTLGTRLIKTRDWTYTTNLTFGYNVNKIVNLKNTPRIIDLIRSEGGPMEGKTVRGLYSIVFQGLDPETGVPTFIDESGKKADAVYVQSLETKYLKYEGPVDPQITGGFNNTLTWKNLSLNVFFSYQVGNKIRLDAAYKSGYTDLDAMPREFLDRWTLPGDEYHTNVPAILAKREESRLDGIYPYTNYNYTDVRVADGSFVRLKTASLNYRLEPSWLNSIKAKSLSVGLVATNLWLIYADKKLKGQDPEFFQTGGVALPMPRQFTLSAKIGF